MPHSAFVYHVHQELEEFFFRLTFLLKLGWFRNVLNIVCLFFKHNLKRVKRNSSSTKVKLYTGNTLKWTSERKWVDIISVHKIG